ncbi:hypothetical protein MSG28_006710 [Choristoneura fumiferana]|uniref:Uncharacterized protein n=1 Tax=Choristoneura fumiferana TaxID=7141 RepID=A0ACC0JKX5_CHOFU|nr:hypothetical protein MSG28_006710 [Choristoneura fumiferana]
MINFLLDTPWYDRQIDGRIERIAYDEGLHGGGYMEGGAMYHEHRLTHPHLPAVHYPPPAAPAHALPGEPLIHKRDKDAIYGKTKNLEWLPRTGKRSFGRPPTRWTVENCGQPVDASGKLFWASSG